MSRAKWKGPYIKEKSLKHLKKNQKNKNFIVSRTSEILPNFLGSNFKIYNGKKYTNITVVEDMIGYKFGAFCTTRSKFIFKQKKSKK